MSRYVNSVSHQKKPTLRRRASVKKPSVKAQDLNLDTVFFRAIAEPTRQKIILILLNKGMSSVQDVAEHLAQDRSVVSRHLASLRQSGIVKSYKVSRFTKYELDGAVIIEKLEQMLEQIRVAVSICCPPTEEVSN